MMTLHHCMQYPCPVCSSTNGNTFTPSVSWNGGVCGSCGAQYLGTHNCSREDIIRRIAELSRLLDQMYSPTRDRMSGCPCRPENGGSGVCGCVLSGPTVTC